MAILIEGIRFKILYKVFFVLGNSFRRRRMKKRGERMCISDENDEEKMKTEKGEKKITHCHSVECRLSRPVLPSGAPSKSVAFSDFYILLLLFVIILFFKIVLRRFFNYLLFYYPYSHTKFTTKKHFSTRKKNFTPCINENKTTTKNET